MKSFIFCCTCNASASFHNCTYVEGLVLPQLFTHLFCFMKSVQLRRKSNCNDDRVGMLLKTAVTIKSSRLSNRSVFPIAIAADPKKNVAIFSEIAIEFGETRAVLLFPCTNGNVNMLKKSSPAKDPCI